MKGNKAMLIFLLIVITINLFVNLYIFSRTRSIFPEAGAGWWIAAVIFWVVAFAYVIGRFSERAGLLWLAEPMIKTGSYWLGAMAYLTLLFLLADILRGLNGLFHLTDFLKFGWMSGKGKTAVLLVYSLSAIILVAGFLSARFPVVRKQAIQINKTVPEGFQKVVLVSDIHLGMMISNAKLKKMVELVNQQNADLVFLAGDVFDEDLGPVIQNNMGDLLKNLQGKQGVFAILGNHEFFGNADAAEKYLKDHHITVLRDSSVTLQNGMTIAGREDISGVRMNGKPRKSIEELLKGIDTEKPVFLLDHQPFKLAEVATKKVDLQVSGHTHHGQLWPFNYMTRAIFEISRGYGKINDTHFYVSSGFGTWGPPIRTSSRSEIIVLEISGK